MTAVLVVRARFGEPVEPLEQVGVDEDGRPGRHMRSYMPRWRPAVNPWHHPVTPSSPRSAPWTASSPTCASPAPPRLPPSVREAGARQMINHRGPEFAAMLDRILDGHEAVLRHDQRRRDDHDRRARAGSRRRSSTRSRPATGCWASASARSATGSPRSPGSTAPTSPSSTSSGATRPPPTRSASACAAMPDGQGRPAHPQRDLDRRHEPDRRSSPPPIREEAPDALILVDSVSGLGAVPFEMDAWGVDVVVTGSQKAWMAAPGPGDDRRLDARLGGDGDGDACRASTSTCGRTATRRPNGETPFTPAIAVVYQVDEGLRLMAEPRAPTASSPGTRPAPRRPGPA